MQSSNIFKVVIVLFGNVLYISGFEQDQLRIIANPGYNGPIPNDNDGFICSTSENNPFSRRSQPICAVKVDNLVEGLSVHGVGDRPYSLTPPWMNYTLYRIGQQFAQDNLMLITYCHYLAAVLTFSSSEGSQVLASTGNSDTYLKATKRTLATFKHTWLWYDHDLLSNDRIAAASIIQLRGIHNHVARFLAERQKNGKGLTDPGMFANQTEDVALWAAVSEDLQTSPIPQEFRNPPSAVINYRGIPAPFPQFGMSLAQLIFAGLPLVMPEILEITKASYEEQLGWNHLWGVLGYAIGIEDKFNLALHPTLEDVKMNYQALLNGYVLPGYFHLIKESKILMEIVAAISDEVLPSAYFSFTPRVVMNLVLKEVFGIDVPRTKSLLAPYELNKLENWERLKVALKTSKQPLLREVNLNLRDNFDVKGRLYYGSKYSNDATAAQYMFSYH